MPRSPRRITAAPRLLLLAAIATMLAGCRSGRAVPDTPPEAAAPDAPATFEERQARWAEHKQQLLGEYDLSSPRVDPADLYSPGLGRDGIASLDAPARVDAAGADFPADDARVIEVAVDGEAVAYPLAILGAHQVVNDVVGGVPIAVTYCPLGDASAVVDRRLPSGEVTQFGVSGLLCRSNLTMYDRATMSLWSQVGMAAMTGPYSGQGLRHLPLRIVSFAAFKARHPAGQVLSPETGFEENYAEILAFFRSYVASDRLYMPVVHDDALPPKTPGLGILAGDRAIFVAQAAAVPAPVRVETPDGPVVVAANEAGMELLEAPAGVDALQCFYFAWSAFYAGTSVVQAPALKLLDGTEKSFLVVGDATSYVWPEMLQIMLDDHAGGLRRYHVLNAVVGGASVERWIAPPDSTDYERTVGGMLRDYFGEAARLRSHAPVPTVALCQPSLQHTRSRRGPVTSADDAEGIRIGADALESLVTRLRDIGIERVYVGTSLYRATAEPESGHERLALAALLQRGRSDVVAGPDLWTATRDCFPDCYDEDGIRPNRVGMQMLAEAWYRTIAGADARQDVIDRFDARDLDVDEMARAYIFRRRGQ